MSLITALSNAVSGLAVAQHALSVTASNIANVNTEGYSRQGNRMNGRSCGLADEGLEVASVPAGALPAVLQAGRGLGPMQQAHGHVLDHGHVLGPVAGP